MPYALKSITVTAGVAPSTDSTPQSTPHYTLADKVRFVEGFPEKIGGWQTLLLSGVFDMNGCARSVYSYVLNNIVYYLIGTHTNLYQVQGNNLFNATPVVTTNTVLNNVLSTNYGTLVNNPFAVVSGIKQITVTDAAHKFIDGDVLTFSGASTFAGLAAGDVTGAKTISNATTNTYTFSTTNTPNATTSGGGAAVARSSRIISVVDANTYREGDNINVVSVAATVGGITSADMEGTRVLRNVTGAGYDFAADATATSAATAAGGNFTFNEEIPDGTLNPTSGSGYGLGLYGVGLYGVSKISTNPTPPTIWSFDRFGTLVVMTPGNQSPLYSWNSGSATLPAIVTNAPAAINYVFVSDNIAVTLGASATPNRIKWSDQGNLTTWTATAQNQAGEDDIEGAGEFISHAQLRGFNLLFTQEAVYTFRYINKPFVWETKQLDASRGLIARNARVVVDGVAYWMGLNNWHMYRGGNVETIPSNTGNESTMKNYVFNNINAGQKSKIFCWYNAAFNEIWWHYPSLSSNECDQIVRVNLLDMTWVMDTMDRTAGEYPTPLTQYPYLANYESTDNESIIYQHELGYDDDGVSLPWFADTPMFSTGAKDTVWLGGIYPDNQVTAGDISLTISVKRYPNQLPGSVTYPIALTTTGLSYRVAARYWQYRVAGDVLGQYWRAGAWMELFKKGGFR